MDSLQKRGKSLAPIFCEHSGSRRDVRWSRSKAPLAGACLDARVDDLPSQPQFNRHVDPMASAAAPRTFPNIP